VTPQGWASAYVRQETGSAERGGGARRTSFNDTDDLLLPQRPSRSPCFEKHAYQLGVRVDADEVPGCALAVRVRAEEPPTSWRVTELTGPCCSPRWPWRHTLSRTCCSRPVGGTPGTADGRACHRLPRSLAGRGRWRVRRRHALNHGGAQPAAEAAEEAVVAGTRAGGQAVRNLVQHRQVHHLVPVRRPAAAGGVPRYPYARLRILWGPG
jgi:hypothetical protein